ncbi:MAG: hypothetical protein SA378_05290 [Sedimentibacter sp.]|uniref:hypothetical protein n=1 Tax=Sedimentibacter sp. TaxID=1960295 RepID=UPI002980FD41|nr:hypothetical protein [Sedimentibacter sp.]MDW5299536.1 hypothetical protein [Sedimentibacter sp.]
MNILDKINELLNEYGDEEKRIVANYRQEKEAILNEYKSNIANDKINILAENSKDAVRKAFNNFISKSKDELARAENNIKSIKPKEKDSLVLNNQLLKLNLIKDNKKALLKEIENNKNDYELLEIIEDMSSPLSNNDEIKQSINAIRNQSPMAILEQAKQNLKYYEIQGTDLSKFNDNSLSAYEIGIDKGSQFNL